MAEYGPDRLAEAKERMRRLEKAQRRQEQLRGRLREKEKQIVELEMKLEAEQADVEKLTRMSLANLFHTLLRSKEEQLELERRQALAAALNLQEARQAQERLKADIVDAGDELAACANAEVEYARLLAEREALLRTSAYAAELAEMDAQIADRSLAAKELKEALTAGRRVMTSLEDASHSLEKAEGWGNWDLWGGGGVISTHMKHEHVDAAKASMNNANHLMRSFRDELADLDRTIGVGIDISGMLKFGDYWFDGLITDWIVQKRIQEAQNQTLGALGEVRAVVNRLQSEFAAADAALQGSRTKRVAWIEAQRP
ncbi:hypothetical protein SAMN02799624_04849 [Paenibacillus sp. UNC496MF]|uniref:hypothetical protein n=1 Tax=Paenibacillus sp. UNC496MF TaxID=1502753 RepID=UPI0008E52870|nr:hypothetical protein [Paenibacillus sp. UNC496MF]SFJ51669.1 hypothetical protein SAMN02799624_04849 [Paenibacillus sp. UNC496MF]